MPLGPLRPCLQPRCPALIRNGEHGARVGRCAEHARGHERQRFASEEGRALYRTERWRRKRALTLKWYPLCVWCLKHGKTTASTVADHVHKHGGDSHAFYHGLTVG